MKTLFVGGFATRVTLQILVTVTEKLDTAIVADDTTRNSWSRRCPRPTT